MPSSSTEFPKYSKDRIVLLPPDYATEHMNLVFGLLGVLLLLLPLIVVCICLLRLWLD